MRVNLANSVFSKKSLSEDLAHYANILGCGKEIINVALSPLEVSIGVCLYTKCANMLEQKARNTKFIGLQVKSGISCLVFRCYGGALYNEMFMKKT